jgi:hypothetical protein
MVTEKGKRIMKRGCFFMTFSKALEMFDVKDCRKNMGKKSARAQRDEGKGKDKIIGIVSRGVPFM